MLRRDFIEEVLAKLHIPIGSYSSFGKLVEYLLIIAQEKTFNLIIDEFRILTTSIQPCLMKCRNIGIYTTKQAKSICSLVVLCIR
jgi:hypothetical protein